MLRGSDGWREERGEGGSEIRKGNKIIQSMVGRKRRRKIEEREGRKRTKEGRKDGRKGG